MGGGHVDDSTNPIDPDKLRQQQIKEENMRAFSASEPPASFNSIPFFGFFDQKVSIPSYLKEDDVMAVEEGFKLAKESLSIRENEWKVERDKATIEKRKPDLSVKFVYGWTLLKSNRVADRTLGKQIMEELIDVNHHSDECIYTMAHSSYMSGDIGEARNNCEFLLRMRPDSAPAQNLHTLIREVQSKENEANVETAAVAGAVVLGLAGVALALAAGGRRR